jgi:hypothetical protein
MGYAPGDKLLIMRHPVHEGLVLCRLESIREFLDEFYVHLEQAAIEHNAPNTPAQAKAENSADAKPELKERGNA